MLIGRIREAVEVQEICQSGQVDHVGVLLALNGLILCGFNVTAHGLQ